MFINFHDQTVQDILINEGFARTSDESFMSKLDHDQRIKTQGDVNRAMEDCDELEEEMLKMLPIEESGEVVEPDLSLRYLPVTLNGPNSPLETHLSSCLHQSRSISKAVIVDTHSVNSILLNANPQVSHLSKSKYRIIRKRTFTYSSLPVRVIVV